MGGVETAANAFVVRRTASLMNASKSFTLHPSFMNLSDSNPVLSNKVFSGKNTVLLGKYAQFAGNSLFYAGIIYSGYNVYNSGFKAEVVTQELINTGMSYYGLVGGPIGWVTSGSWFVMSNTLGTPQNIRRMQNDMLRKMKSKSLQRVHGPGAGRGRNGKPINWHD